MTKENIFPNDQEPQTAGGKAMRVGIPTPGRLAHESVQLFIAVDYGCPACGEFQVIHSYRNIQRSCQHCGGVVHALAVDFIGVKGPKETQFYRMPNDKREGPPTKTSTEANQ